MDAVMWAPWIPPRTVVAPRAATAVAGSPVVRKVAAAAALPAARPMLMAFLPGRAKGLDANTPCSLPNATAEPACHNRLHSVQNGPGERVTILLLYTQAQLCLGAQLLLCCQTHVRAMRREAPWCINSHGCVCGCTIRKLQHSMLQMNLKIHFQQQQL